MQNVALNHRLRLPETMFPKRSTIRRVLYYFRIRKRQSQRLQRWLFMRGVIDSYDKKR
jgi:hypothetical protein